MPSSPASRLFHAIVVAGASVGCASAEQVPGAPSQRTPAQPGVGDASAEAGAGLADAGPHTYCDCPRPGEFRCRACAGLEAPVDGRCPGNDGVDCRCDPSVAVAAPTDCAHPEQFACASSIHGDAATSPQERVANNWYSFARCECDPARPLLPSECACERCSFLCQAGTGCGAATPGGQATSGLRWGCACEAPPLPVTVGPQ